MDLYCHVCNVYVQERTKHCGPCNRCCEEFDHHCNWLNNCIGTENYATFRKLITAYLVYTLSSVLLFIQSHLQELAGEVDTNGQAAIILLWIQFAFNMLALLFMVQLIAFHSWLTGRGLTTFEYIQYRRELAIKKKELQNGDLTVQELEKWKREALECYVPQKKSKTIVRKEKDSVAVAHDQNRFQ